MTVQPTRDQLRAHLRRLIGAWDGPGNPSVSTADLAQLLDQLDQAEAELDSWMTRAYEAEKRAWQAEARIRAVYDACDLSAEDAEDMDAISAHYASGYEIALQDIRRALDT